MAWTWNRSVAYCTQLGLKVAAALMAAGIVLLLCFGYTQGVYMAEHFEVFQRSPGAATEYLRVTYGYESRQLILSALRPFIFHKQTYYVSPGSPSDPIRFVVLESGTGRPHWLHTKWEYARKGRTGGRNGITTDVTRKVLLEAMLTLPDGTQQDLRNSHLMYAIVGNGVRSRPVDVRKGQVDSFIRFWLMRDFSLDGLERCAHGTQADLN